MLTVWKFLTSENVTLEFSSKDTTRAIEEKMELVNATLSKQTDKLMYIDSSEEAKIQLSSFTVSNKLNSHFYDFSPVAS